MTKEMLDAEVTRLMALPIEELQPELKKKTNPELSELGLHSKELVAKLCEHLSKKA